MSGFNKARVFSVVTLKSGCACWKWALVITNSVDSIAFALTPALSRTAPSKRTHIRSPMDATVSITRGLASLRIAIALQRSTSERMSALISCLVASRKVSSLMSASAAVKCFSLSVDSVLGSESTFPCEASSAESNNKLVTPDIAEVITTTRGYSARASFTI